MTSGPNHCWRTPGAVVELPSEAQPAAACTPCCPHGGDLAQGAAGRCTEAAPANHSVPCAVTPASRKRDNEYARSAQRARATMSERRHKRIGTHGMPREKAQANRLWHVRCNPKRCHDSRCRGRKRTM